jgi:hypothetical protein
MKDVFLKGFKVERGRNGLSVETGEDPFQR